MYRMSFALVHHNKNKAQNTKTSTAPAKPSPQHHFNNLVMDSHDSIIHLKRAIGNQAAQALIRSNIGFDFAKTDIQPKLKVSQPGDLYEQEADRVAEQVMRMRILDSVAPVTTAKDERIDRKCSGCEMAKGDKEDEKLDINRKPSSTSSLEWTSKIANKINMIHSGAGMPLGPVIRTFMEQRIGYDFSKVRVHIDSKATESARLVGAQAYTVGSDIVFGAGQFSPHTPSGRQLLAHELTHTVQQSEGVAQGIQRQPADVGVAAQPADAGVAAQPADAGVAAQPADAGVTSVAVQPSVAIQPNAADQLADIDSDLQKNQQGEKGAREIVAGGFGGEKGLNELFNLEEWHRCDNRLILMWLKRVLSGMGFHPQ